MTRKTKNSLVVIQTGISILTLLMCAAGLFGIYTTKKIEELQRKSFDVSFDEKMRPSIGKTYTEKKHYQLLELTRIHGEVNASSNKSLAIASEVMRDFGGILALASLASIFLLTKKPHSPKQVTEDSRP